MVPLRARYLINYQRNHGLKSLLVAHSGTRVSCLKSEAPTPPQPTGEPDHLSSSAAGLSLDHFTGKVTRSYLTGTVPHSIIIDITNVLDKKKTFIVDLATFCEGNTHLWAVSKQIRKENSRLFAEISVSPSMYQKFFQSPTLKLKNFDEPFMAYPSLSLPSVNIDKLSLHKLPPQYGRQNGDVQLRNDMRFNLHQFGKLIDCGYVTGGSGIYAGGG